MLLYITRLTGCSDRTPRPGRGATSAPPGCNRCSHGVQWLHPNPSLEVSGEPSAVLARMREAPTAADGPAVGGGRDGEFFAALGSGWRLIAAQRVRLTPAVRSALGAGWTPQALAAFTGANTSGVRNAYAVLAARLSPVELPPPGQRPARPPWCGECDQDTRMLDFDGDTPRRCPRCKPSAVMNRTPLAEPISIRDLGGAGFHRAQHGVVRFEDFMPGPGKR